MVQLQRVRYFIAAAEAGTISAAGRSVFVTQPALSRQIRQLERELGVDLFDRSGGRLALSRSGMELLPWARALVAAASALQAKALLLEQRRLDRVLIAAPLEFLTGMVSPFVASMSAHDPVVEVLVSDTTSFADNLLNGADLAIGLRAAPARPFATVELPELPLWAYVRTDDPWARRDSVSVQELLTRSVITEQPGFAAREVLDSALLEVGVPLGGVFDAPNGRIAQAMAARGRGVAVVSVGPRFGLKPVAVNREGVQLSVCLVIAWQRDGTAASRLSEFARRIVAPMAEHHLGATVPDES